VFSFSLSKIVGFIANGFSMKTPAEEVSYEFVDYSS